MPQANTLPSSLRKLIRMTAPTLELAREGILLFLDGKEKLEEKELKEEGAGQEEVKEEKETIEVVIQERDDKEKSVLQEDLCEKKEEAKKELDLKIDDPKPSNKKEKAEKEKAEKEKSDYFEFVKTIKSLKEQFNLGRKQATKKKDRSSLAYLDHFEITLAEVLPKLQNTKIEVQEKNALINELIAAAKPSPQTTLEAAEPYLSPVLGILGAVIGAAVGIPVGAIVGAVAGFAGLCFIFAKSGGNVPIDLFATQGGSMALGIFLGACGVVGAVMGVFYGATTGAKELYSMSHNAFFKPSEMHNQANKILKSPTLNKYLGGRAITHEIKAGMKAASEAKTEMVPDLLGLISEYNDPQDKEAAYRQFHGVRSLVPTLSRA